MTDGGVSPPSVMYSDLENNVASGGNISSTPMEITSSISANPMEMHDDNISSSPMETQMNAQFNVASMMATQNCWMFGD